MVKKALLIGINYFNTASQLNGCINDIKNINLFLVNNCNYDPENIRILTDDTSNNTKPTKENIEKYMFWLISNINAGDTLYFHYSGHGYYTIDYSGEEIDNRDEVFVPLDYEENGYISDDWIYYNILKKIPKDVTFIAFSDCCHSGTILDLKYNFKINSEYKKGNITKELKYKSSEWSDEYYFYMEKENIENLDGNIIMFTGCQDEQTSADAYIQSQSQGAFTHCLLDTLQKKLLLQNDKLVFISIQIRELLKEVNAKLRINGFSQRSQLSLSNFANFENNLFL